MQVCKLVTVLLGYNRDGIHFNEGKQNIDCIQEVMNCLNVLFICVIHDPNIHVVTIYTADRHKIFLIIIIMIRFVACWVQLKARIQKHRGKPLLFHDKCPGFFYVHYTTHGTYSFTSHPKNEAIMVKCLAQGHKRRDRP